MPGYWILYASLACELLGGLRGAIASLDERPGPRFLQAALQIDSGHLADAAVTLRGIGAPELEAEVLVLAAGEGDDAALARARELLSGLGATARLRQLEASSRSA